MAYTNLDYLRNITGGDPESMCEIIVLFMEQVPEFIANLKKHLENKNYIELGKEAHKAKSSLMILGMNELGLDMKSLQMATINKTGEDKYAFYVDQFEKQCLMAVEELKKEMTRLK